MKRCFCSVVQSFSVISGSVMLDKNIVKIGIQNFRRRAVVSTLPELRNAKDTLRRLNFSNFAVYTIQW